jgi:hypothetical protein
VLEHHWPALFAMTLRAGFVQARQRQSAGGLPDIYSVGIVALGAVHFAIEHGMMLGKVEFRLYFRMTLKTRGGIFAGIDDKPFEAAAPAHSDVFAARPVARFTTVLASHSPALQMQTGVRACREYAGDIFVAIGARFVAHKRRAFDLQRHDGCTIGCRTGTEKQCQQGETCAGQDSGHAPNCYPSPVHAMRISKTATRQ